MSSSAQSLSMQNGRDNDFWHMTFQATCGDKDQVDLIIFTLDHKIAGLRPEDSDALIENVFDEGWLDVRQDWKSRKITSGTIQSGTDCEFAVHHKLNFEMTLWVARIGEGESLSTVQKLSSLNGKRLHLEEGGIFQVYDRDPHPAPDRRQFKVSYV